MNLPIDDTVIIDALVSRLTRQPGYREAPPLARIAADEAGTILKPVLVQLMVEAGRATLTDPATRERLEVAIRDGLVDGAREWAVAEGKRRAKKAVTDG